MANGRPWMTAAVRLAGAAGRSMPSSVKTGRTSRGGVVPVLWVLWGIGVLNVVAMFASIGVYLLLVRFTKVDLPGLPLFVVMLGIVTTPVSGVSGLLLILLTDAGAGVTAGLVVGTVVLLAGPVLAIATRLGNWWRGSRRKSRIDGWDER